MILKIKSYIDSEYGPIQEDYIIENPRGLSIQPNRTYNLKLHEKMGIEPLSPLSHEDCNCNFIFYYLDEEFHSYACCSESIFLMSDSGKTIDRY